MRIRLAAAGLFLLLPCLVLAACTPGGPPAQFGGTPVPTTPASTGVDPSKQFTAPGEVLEVGKQYTATIVTDKGTIVIELYADKAPRTVNSFVFLAQQGFYNGLTFHRVVPGFVVQGGDPLGNGTGGPGYAVEQDENDLSNTQWTIAMARSAGSTQVGSQFFINLVDNPSLDQSTAQQGRFYPFGKVTGGTDVVATLVAGDVMRSVTISSN
jgi:cyclophilin family peptidyl-prolyl cis-trans isomerase